QVVLPALFRAAVRRRLSGARLARAVAPAVAVRRAAAAGLDPDRGRRRAVFSRRRLLRMEGAAVPNRDLAWICRAGGGLPLCRDLASGHIGGRHALIDPRQNRTGPRSDSFRKPAALSREDYRKPSSFSATIRSCPSALFLMRYCGAPPSKG